MTTTPLLYVARHAETAFNRAARMQGQHGHTPLTRTGFAQADAMGIRLRNELGAAPDIALWCSSAGRTRQTLAIICEHLGVDYFTARADDRLQEIHVGDWQGRTYAEIHDEIGTFVDTERRLFTVKPPAGEWYDDIAHRLRDWLGELDQDRPALIITHGISGRILRGMLAGGRGRPPIAPDAPQGTIFRIENGRETALEVEG